MLTLILLNAQIYQALESVIMNHRVHYIHDLGLSYFYRIKAMSLITADQLQWTIYVKIKSRVYMCIKKLAQNFPGLLISHQVNGNVYLSYLYFTHSLLQVSVTQIQQQLSRVTIRITIKAYYKGYCQGLRFFNVHQSFSPPKVITTSQGFLCTDLYTHTSRNSDGHW